MANFHKKFKKTIRKQIKPLILDTLKIGANNIGYQLLDAVSDVNQPSDVIQGKITAALKSGAIATGRDAARAGFERFSSSN